MDYVETNSVNIVCIVQCIRAVCTCILALPHWSTIKTQAIMDTYFNFTNLSTTTYAFTFCLSIICREAHLYRILLSFFYFSFPCCMGSINSIHACGGQQTAKSLDSREVICQSHHYAHIRFCFRYLPLQI